MMFNYFFDVLLPIKMMFSTMNNVYPLSDDSQFGARWLSMGGKGALNYLPIVPKAFVHVPKVMRKPVMGSNTVYETSTHVFLFRTSERG